MERANVNGVDLAYEVSGEGEPVLLIHGACIADAMKPLGEQLEGFKVIRYHRRGYGESTGEPPSDVRVHAADARALLEHLAASPAHVIGHSYGGTTALQLGADDPACMRSLVLLEPALAGQIPSAAETGEALGAVVAPALEGRMEEATDRFLTAVCGPDWKKQAEATASPSAVAQSFADADDALASDLPSFGTWAFGGEEARAITCPTLVVLGEESDQTVRDAFVSFGIADSGVSAFREMADLAHEWVSGSELVTLPGMNHSLQMQDAAGVARVVAPFLTRNRVSA
jgi:pimeloyl-ACP methyl ester carboxylesterase